MKIINYDNYIKIGDRYYPPNSYILSIVDDNLVVITTLDNNINVTLAWTQFTDVNDDPYATLEDVITALLANNAFPPVIPANTITGTLTPFVIPKAKSPVTHVLENSQIVDNGTTVFIGAAATSAKAIFDLISTTKGFFVPRMTTAQQAAIAAGATDTALLLFNLTLGRFTFYNHSDTTFKKLLIPEDIGNITVDSMIIESSHTGNTNETILGYLEIPASTFITKDKCIVDYLYNSLGNNAAKEFKIYINTLPLLNGSQVQLGRISQTATGAGGRFLRNFSVKNLTTLKCSLSGSNNLNTDYVNNGTYTEFTIPTLEAAQYLIITGILTSALDTVLLQSAEILRTRKVA